MSLVQIDEDPWLTEFAALQRLSQEINLQITERDSKNSSTGKKFDKIVNHQKHSYGFISHISDYNRISARIRIKLKQFEGELQQLQKKLQARNTLITQQEKERRQQELNVLASRKVQLDSRFQNVPGSATRAELFEKAGMGGSSSQDDAILGNNENVSVESYRNEQRQILKEQDKGLENLSKVISRQKQLAMNIGTEIEEQTDIIDNIADQMDHTDDRVRRETRNVGDITTEDSTCGYWIVIISLAVAIIIVGIL